MSTDHYGRTTYDSDPTVDDDEEQLPYQGHTHTQFLDLTNGEGGDRTMYYDGEDDDDVEYHEIMVPPPSNAAVARRNNNKGNIMLNNNGTNAPRQQLQAPPGGSGRVVESGQDHTGRWTREEHEAFLSALNQYGKEWKKVAAKVKTRTVVQTRTHAQKYFQKMIKTVVGDHTEDGQRVHPGDSLDTMAEGKKASAQKKQRKAARAAAAAATSAAAQLLTNLPSIPSSTTAPSQPQQHASSSAFPAYPTHGFSSSATTLASLPPPPAYSAPKSPQQQQQKPLISTSYFGNETSSSWGPPAATTSSSTNHMKKATMSIVAPDASTVLRGGFPEPSPAACGTRKLAELAAAQMLAGVAASGAKSSMLLTPKSSQEEKNEQHRQSHHRHPSDLYSVDGDVTPPPPLSQSREAGYTPPPRMGLSLQIVNPESLGITYNETRRRNRDGEPTTPWDGQLEQLVT